MPEDVSAPVLAASAAYLSSRALPSTSTTSTLQFFAAAAISFLSAGTALFRDGGFWEAHASVGVLLALPALALAGGALSISRLRGFGWWAGLVFLLYLVQVVLAAGSQPLPLSFHPVNGALLLTASLVLQAKVERRRAQPVPSDAD